MTFLTLKAVSNELTVNELKSKKTLIAFSAYFDEERRSSCRLLVLKVKDIQNLPIQLQDSLNLLCKFYECTPNDVIEIICEINRKNISLIYMAVINNEKTKTYSYRFGTESFFFNEYNQVVGVDGICVTNTLPIQKSEYFITSRFGIRANPFKKNKTNHFHHGLDFSAKQGTPIYAMADGAVTTSFYKYDYGNHIVIDHEGGLQTLYAHMQKLPLLNKGEMVRKGQIIGYVGSTGYATGPHLHLEVRHHGVRCNPELFFGFSKKILKQSHHIRQNFIKSYVNRLHEKMVTTISNKASYNILKLSTPTTIPNPLLTAPAKRIKPEKPSLPVRKTAKPLKKVTTTQKKRASTLKRPMGFKKN